MAVSGTHGRVVEHGTRKYNNGSYKICAPETGYFTIKTTEHINQMSTPPEQYCCDEIIKAENLHQSGNDLNRLFNTSPSAYTDVHNARDMPRKKKQINYMQMAFIKKSMNALESKPPKSLRL